MASTLDPLFAPRSIAVIGASTKDGSVGQAVLTNLILNRFNGIVYPVNPKAKGILGVRCYPSIMEVPDEVDLAAIIVPSTSAPDVMEQCGKKGVRSAVIISAGFREVGAEGKRLEQEVAKIARRYRIPLVGPNCLGIINADPSVRLNASFATHMPASGSIAFVSQSGALCTAILDYARAEHIGFSKFVSMGNKAHITENDLLLYLKDDSETRVILLYLEDLVDGRRFIEIAREITGEIEHPKPILVIKSGRTLAGAKAAASHTGSLAGQDEVYDAIFAQSGVLRVDTVEELFDYAVAFSKQPLPKGRRVAIVTNASGPGIMATDACIRYGLEMSALRPETTEHLRKGLPPTANLHNPVDVIGDAQHDRYEHALGSVLADPNVDGLIVILTPQAMTDIETIAQTVVEAAKLQQKPVLASFMGVMDVSAGVKVLERHGVPHYKFPEGACRALASMARYVTWLERPRTEVRCFVVDRLAAQAVIDRVRAEERCNLVEVEAGNILKAYNIPVVESTIAGTVGEAEAVAAKVGYPVVIKIASPDILHKADVRGVAVGIEDAEQLRRTHQRMMANVAAAAPTAKILGVTVQPMMRGREVIIGMKRDERFGPMIMFGLGGTYVEVFKDVTFRLAPIREYGAERMVRSIKASKILNGFRGEPPADLEAVKECLLRVSQLAMDLRDVEELDINPLVVFERDKGCMALDARIVLSQQAVAPKQTELQAAVR